MKQKMSLPIDPFLVSIGELFKTHQNLVILASPGAGKTTRVPPLLATLVPEQICILVPRRIAAIGAAHRVCQEFSWNLGQEVGYQVRYESRLSQMTQILFMTEATLIRRLMNNSQLKGISAIVLDEFHERSIHTDLALAALKELQSLERPDLKLVIMSATLDPQALLDYLPNSQKIEVPGQVFPLQISLQKRPLQMNLDRAWISDLGKFIYEKALEQKNSRHLLVFLPGMREILNLKSELEAKTHAERFDFHILHSQISFELQAQALAPSERTKVILATNICESSITIDGVDTVIDTGLVRMTGLNHKTGFANLELRRISKASATQRAGRAARQFPGQCFQMWNQQDELSMKDYELPEIFRVDLSESLLALAALKVGAFSNFSWFTPPHPARLKSCEDLLRNLQLVDQDCSLTSLGVRAAKLPIHPRLAILVLGFSDLGYPVVGAEFAAILSEPERNYQKGSDYPESDLLPMWEAFCNHPPSFPQWSRARDHFLKYIPPGKIETTDHTKVFEALQLILVRAFPDQVCRRRQKTQPSALTSEGLGVTLGKNSNLKTSEFFVALQINELGQPRESVVTLASGLDTELFRKTIAGAIEERTVVEFDENSESIKTLKGKYWRKLPLGTLHSTQLSSEETHSALCRIVQDRWSEFTDKNLDLQQLLLRYEKFQELHSSAPRLEEFKLDWISQVCFGEYSLKVVKNKDWKSGLENLIGRETAKLFASDCPEILEVPSGSKIKIHYAPDKQPYIEVRLQEIFGWHQTPTILMGTVKICLHLLGPHFRPIQITQDLLSFWNNTYPEVKKDLKSRYPKHSWPEDPFSAKPEAKGRRRS